MQRAPECVVLFLRSFRKGQSTGTKTKWLPGAGDGREWGETARRAAFPFRGMKTFQNLIEEVAAHGVNVTGILQ